ncbi:MAG: hypothetical protein HY762_03355 [Planctomycetes bacterium]|nr:hypothetical protein [Planctomycetota bacterium]
MPSQKAPHKPREIVYLIARLISPSFIDQLPYVQAYYHTGSGQATCAKCVLERDQLARLLCQLRHEYNWLYHQTENGNQPFRLKEIIALVSIITMRIIAQPLAGLIIRAYYETDANVKAICRKYPTLSVRTCYRYIQNYVTNPYLIFCDKRGRRVP